MDNIINNSKTFFNESMTKTFQVINQIVQYILNIIISNIGDFYTFIFEKNIISTGIGIIIATNISSLTNMFTEVIISPIIKGLSGGNTKNLESLSFTIFGIEFKIGLLLKNLIDFLCIIIVVFYIWKLSQITDINKIIDPLKKIKTNVVISVSGNTND